MANITRLVQHRVKYFRILLLTITLLTVCGNPEMFVTGSSLSLRDEPGGKILASIPAGESVEILASDAPQVTVAGKQGSWYQVAYQEQEGYVFSAYLSDDQELRKTIQACVEADNKWVSGGCLSPAMYNWIHQGGALTVNDCGYLYIFESDGSIRGVDGMPACVKEAPRASVGTWAPDGDRIRVQAEIHGCYETYDAGMGRDFTLQEFFVEIRDKRPVKLDDQLRAFHSCYFACCA